MARCRAYVHPLRWTSLGLALLEAMHLGMPVLALATTEASRAVPPEAGASPPTWRNCAGVPVSWSVIRRRPGGGARLRGKPRLERYGLERFLADWDEVLADLVPAGPELQDRDWSFQDRAHAKGEVFEGVASEGAALKGSGPDALSAAREGNAH